MLKTEQKNYYKEIYYGEIHVATHVKPKYAPMNLSFVTDDSKFLQLGNVELSKRKRARQPLSQKI